MRHAKLKSFILSRTRLYRSGSAHFEVLGETLSLSLSHTHTHTLSLSVTHTHTPRLPYMRKCRRFRRCGPSALWSVSLRSKLWTYDTTTGAVTVNIGYFCTMFSLKHSVETSHHWAMIPGISSKRSCQPVYGIGHGWKLLILEIQKAGVQGAAEVPGGGKGGNAPFSTEQF